MNMKLSDLTVAGWLLTLITAVLIFPLMGLTTALFPPGEYPIIVLMFLGLMAALGVFAIGSKILMHVGLPIVKPQLESQPPSEKMDSKVSTVEHTTVSASDKNTGSEAPKLLQGISVIFLGLGILLFFASYNMAKQKAMERLNLARIAGLSVNQADFEIGFSDMFDIGNWDTMDSKWIGNYGLVFCLMSVVCYIASSGLIAIGQRKCSTNETPPGN